MAELLASATEPPLDRALTQSLRGGDLGDRMLVEVKGGEEAVARDRQPGERATDERGALLTTAVIGRGRIMAVEWFERPTPEVIAEKRCGRPW